MILPDIGNVKYIIMTLDKIEKNIIWFNTFIKSLIISDEAYKNQKIYVIKL